MDLCVRNGTVLTPEGLREADVGVRDGTIAAVGDVGEADRELDATDSLVLPGLVNTHTHAAMTLLRGYADDLPLGEWLSEYIWPVEAHLEPEDVEAGARLAALEMIRTGTTAFADMYFEMDRVAEAVADSGLRARLGYGIITEGKDDAAAREEVETGIRFAREYDGAADGRVRTMLTPHAPYTCGDWVFEEVAAAADDIGVPVHVHLAETSDNVEESLESTGERPAVHLDGLDFWDRPAYVAHGVHLDADDRALLAERGVGVAHCPSANMKLASGAAPVEGLRDAGATVALGTDGPSSNNELDMFSEMRHAALLAKLREDDAAALPAETVVEMATRAGAELLGLDAGAIEAGRAADLAVLDLDRPNLTPRHDLVSHAVYAASGKDVTATVVDGEVLMEGGEVLTLDEEAVIAEADERAMDLVERAGHP